MSCVEVFPLHPSSTHTHFPSPNLIKHQVWFYTHNISTKLLSGSCLLASLLQTVNGMPNLPLYRERSFRSKLRRVTKSRGNGQGKDYRFLPPKLQNLSWYDNLISVWPSKFLHGHDKWPAKARKNWFGHELTNQIKDILISMHTIFSINFNLTLTLG